MYTMKESVAVAKEADAKKGVSPTRSDNSIHRVRNEPERQLGSLRGVIGNITRNGGMPSVENIATELSGVHATQRAPALLALQQTHGNRYVQRVVAGIQAKLKVGQPGDVYEQEADRVAEQVMRMPEPQVQRQGMEEEMKEEKLIQTKYLSDQITPLMQRQPIEEEEEETIQPKEVSTKSPPTRPDIEANIQSSRTGGTPLPKSTRAFFEPRFGHDFSKVKLHTNTRAAELARTEITPLMQRQESLGEVKDEELIQTKIARDVTPELTPTISSGIQSLQGGGRPLSGSERSFFEPRFGTDFSNVRVHDDTRAANVAQSVNARAFTHGRNVVFGAGEHSQDTLAGRKLLAHELTHVVQQNGGPTLISASKNFENTIPKAQKLSIVSPNFPVQRSLLWVPIGLAALVVVLLACAQPFVQIALSRYGNKSDKWRHCWVSCEISKTCGSAIAQLAGLAQEVVQNLLVRGHPLIRSLLDMLANNVCIPPETGIVSVFARLWRQSCENCCNEAERQGVLPMLEQMEEEALEQMEEEAEEEATLQTKPLVGHTPPLMQRQVGPPEQTTSLGTQAIASPDLQHRITALQGSGQPLSQAERNFFEPRFGVDFSQVRIHANRRGSENARAISARAFTVGKNIVFGAGEYAPQTNDGKRLLAHELTHVVQQTAGGSFQKNLKSISKFINTGEQISRLLRIRGGADFEHEVNNDLGQLRGATAQNLLSTLRSSWWTTVEINRVQHGCATRIVNDIVLVFFNPSRCPIAPRDDVWDGPSVPNAIYLAHELIHALHHFESTHNSSRPVEEWRTVGLGRYATLPTTENRIRCEMRLPLRTFYYADDQQQYRLQGFNPPRCEGYGDLIEPSPTPIHVGEGILGEEQSPQTKLVGNSEDKSVPRPIMSPVQHPVVQRWSGCASESEPRPIAVRYGPGYIPYQDQENDIYGIIFDAEVICGGCTDRIGNLSLFEEREQLSNSFQHTDSFQHVRRGESLPFSEQASGWQTASSVRPDRHGLPLGLITEAAERGNGTFAIHQLDIYKRVGSADDTARVIPYSGYKVVYSVIIPPESTEGSILLRVDKIPEACTISGYSARAGSTDSDGTPSPPISGSIYVRGGGTLRSRHSHILRSGRGVGSEVTPSSEKNINSSIGDGEPLPSTVRTFFEPRFGYDFSRVRIHSDRWAAESAQMLNARAFTTGRDVVFATGQYAPWSNEGQRLLAHELTHVIQQRKASKNLVQAYRFDAYPSSAASEFRGLGAYAERMEQEGRAIAFPVTDLSNLHTKMNEEKQRRISEGIQDNLVNELHLYGHGLPGQLQIGGVNYTHIDLRDFNETLEELMQPGAIIFAESCLSAQGEEGWELFRQLGRVFFGNRDGWLQGNTEDMRTVAGPIEARPRLFRYPRDFRVDFRNPSNISAFSSADQEFLRSIDINDSQLPRALISGMRYSVNAVSNTHHPNPSQSHYYFAKFTIYTRGGPYVHASGSAPWPHGESSGPPWTFGIGQMNENGEYNLTLRIWTHRDQRRRNISEPARIQESDRLNLRIIRIPLNVRYPRI